MGQVRFTALEKHEKTSARTGPAYLFEPPAWSRTDVKATPGEGPAGFRKPPSTGKSQRFGGGRYIASHEALVGCSCTRKGRGCKTRGDLLTTESIAGGIAGV